MLIPPKAGASINKDRSSAKRMMLTQVPEQSIFKGQVTDQAGTPLPFATIKAGENGIETVADANGKFTLKAPDSILQVKVRAVGYDSALAQIKSQVAANNIVLSESGLTLGDIVAMDYSKKQSNKSEASKDVSKKKFLAEIEAEPYGGWPSFQQYLHQSIDSLRATDDNIPVDEDIVLEFSIDKQGKPVDIKAQEEADKIIADKAKQILTKGPKWKNKQKDKKVKVVISF